MAAYSGQQSKYFSSSGSLDDFQYNNGILEKSQDTNYVPEINQRIPEIILSDAGNACDNFTLNFKNNKECESALKLGKDEVIYPKCQFDLNGHETKNKNVTPNFNVGGLVSTNYHSQPNLNDIVNNQEETNPSKFVKQPNSYSIHTHPKSGDEPHCLHEQINQTDLACFIQDALGERCNIIQVDPSASKINLQSQVVEYVTGDIIKNIIEYVA